MSTLRVPPGRAGRLRLRRRLEVAARGADLLDRKLRALLVVQRALRQAAEASDRAWRESAAAATTWLGRALAAGGRDALRQALPAAPALVAVHDAVSMGVRYPASAECELPDRDSAIVDPGNAALICARDAYQDAARKGVQAAVDCAAARTVDAAVATTRQQLRALRRHWIPRLEEAVAHLELVLEQADFEDGVRRRRAAGSERLSRYGEGRGRAP
ncbi:MAG TPA: V-type ATP synthase subunit D [Actinocrinis sp.]|nr:V-type ATP synthase subunit D [Actinocrinis sp.]